MKAMDLCGVNVGFPITYRNLKGQVRGTNGEPITMITHKKNGNVLIRYGKRNAQAELEPLTEILSVV